MTTAEIATLGHNQPPVTPFDECQAKIGDLYGEAKNWLDGDEIENQQQADALSKLLDEIRKAAKEADEHRKVEKKPHDDAAKAVQAKWKPLIDDCDRAADAAKKALTPFLQKQEAEKRRKAEEARREAEEKERAAREAIQASRGDLEAREAAERQLEEAKAAEASARKAEKDRGTAKGGARAVSLRTSYRAEVIDHTAFARWVWLNDPEAINGFLDEYAARMVRQGKRAGMPGVTVHEDQGAV
jgi:hypothetical protein